ncbi:hypothetical protein CFIO01_10752 [Colletotrichum fioriniae PJ7]|uniref:Uncharacterized protein n=1 Tax=Colletotrichum fioriniae PJ7 TaxID=1445577 RepID=A0A010SEQ1_9PEZI|nr:hypothetical protein CFIO01_10752 [Colletotrichum fioriniae PJ7]
MYLGGTAVSHHLSKYSWLVLYFGAGAPGCPGTPWTVPHLMAPTPSDSSVVSPSHPGPGTRTFLATPSRDSPNPCLVFPSPATWAVPGQLLLGAAGAAAAAAAAALDCSERESDEGERGYHSFPFASLPLWLCWCLPWSPFSSPPSLLLVPRGNLPIFSLFHRNSRPDRHELQ